MESAKLKPLSSLIFYPLLSLIFIRPFISGLAYQGFEFYYELSMLSIAGIIILPRICRGGLNLPYKSELALLISAYIISTITSINIHNSLKESLKFLSYVSIFFAVSQTDAVQKKNIIKIIVTAAVIISAYSIYQYFWGFQHTIDYLRKTDSGLLSISSYTRDILLSKRAIGTFPSPNILGSYLIMMLFLSLYVFFSTPFGRSKNIVRARPEWPSRELLLAALPIIIILSALILTKSLGAWLSLVLTLIISLIISYNKLQKYKRLIAIGFIFIFFVLLFIVLNRWERIMDLNNPENSITQRLNYWRTAVGVIKDHPILGVGPGNFQEVFLKYKIGLSTDTRYAHNIFLHQWAETGILGFLGIFYLIFNLHRRIRLQTEQKFIFLAILAFIFHNLIDNSYFIPETGVLWWALVGLIL